MVNEDSPPRGSSASISFISNSWYFVGVFLRELRLRGSSAASSFFLVGVFLRGESLIVSTSLSSELLLLSLPSPDLLLSVAFSCLSSSSDAVTLSDSSEDLLLLELSC